MNQKRPKTINAQAPVHASGPLLRPVRATTLRRVTPSSNQTARGDRAWYLTTQQTCLVAVIALSSVGFACHPEYTRQTVTPELLQVHPHLHSTWTEQASHWSETRPVASLEPQPAPEPSISPTAPTSPSSPSAGALTRTMSHSRQSPSASSSYVLMGIDCFGTPSPEQCQALSTHAGLSIGQRIAPGWSGQSLLEQVRLQHKYAFVSISPTFYTDGTAYITIDVVEHRDQRRLNLRTAPAETVNFSSDLLDLYGQYTNMRLALLQRGVDMTTVRVELSLDERSNMSRLNEFERHFKAQVPFHRDALIDVCVNDRDPTWRRAAAGLLGFDSHNQSSLDALSLALLDAEHLVRNEAAQALLAKLRLAHGVGKPLINIDPAIDLLFLPSTADRAAAISLLTELAQVPSQRNSIVKRAFPILSQMLLASRPKANKSAVALLEIATGLDFGRDVGRWQRVIGSPE